MTQSSYLKHSGLHSGLVEEVAELWAIADSDEAIAEVLRLVEEVRSRNSVA